MNWRVPVPLAFLGGRRFRRRLDAGAGLQGEAGPAVRVSPDGSRVAFVVATAAMEGEKSEWLSQVHVARTDGSGAFQLTRARSRRPRPRGRPTASGSRSSPPAGKDKDGKEPKANLWRIRVDGGEAEALTDEKGGVSARVVAGRQVDRVPDDRPEDRGGGEGGQGEARRARGGRRAEADPALRGAGGEGRGRQAAGPQADRGRDERRQPGGPGGVRLVARRAKRSPSRTSPRRTSTTGRGRTSRWWTSQTGPCGRWPPPAPPSRTRSSRPTAPVAFDLSDDPPTWRRRSRVAWCRRRAARRGLLAETHDEQPDLLGWTTDGRVRVRRDAPHGRTACARCPWTAARRRLEPGGMMVDGPALNASRHARRASPRRRRTGRRRRSSAPLRALRARAGGRCRTLPAIDLGGPRS